MYLNVAKLTAIALKNINSPATASKSSISNPTQPLFQTKDYTMPAITFDKRFIIGTNCYSDDETCDTGLSSGAKAGIVSIRSLEKILMKDLRAIDGLHFDSRSFPSPFDTPHDFRY